MCFVCLQVGCKDCGRIFCSKCAVVSGQTSQCKKCRIITSGTFTKSQLNQMKIKDLKALLMKQNINTSKCKEKEDLIELIYKNFGNPSNPYRRDTESRTGFTPVCISLYNGAVYLLLTPLLNHFVTHFNYSACFYLVKIECWLCWLVDFMRKRIGAMLPLCVITVTCISVIVCGQKS